MIKVEAVWLAVEPPDMRADTEAALARVFGAARPHHAYLLANRRANRMKFLGEGDSISAESFICEVDHDDATLH